MIPSEPQNTAARAYLHELRSALADLPDHVREEIVADISDELRGLDDAAVRARIQELGDPRAIAADARNETTTMTTTTVPARGYPIATSVVLIAGWYVVPIFGWVAGLVMIGVGSHWARMVRRNGIIASVAVILVSSAAVFVFRGSSLWLIGAIVFGAGPLIGNIFVASYLRGRWGASTPQ